MGPRLTLTPNTSPSTQHLTLNLTLAPPVLLPAIRTPTPIQVDLCLIDINLGPGITGVEVLQSRARVRVRAWVRARVMG